MYRSDIYLSSEMGSLWPTYPNIYLGVENGMSVEMGTHLVTQTEGVRVVRQLFGCVRNTFKYMCSNTNSIRIDSRIQEPTLSISTIYQLNLKPSKMEQQGGAWKTILSVIRGSKG